MKWYMQHPGKYQTFVEFENIESAIKTARLVASCLPEYITGIAIFAGNKNRDMSAPDFTERITIDRPGRINSFREVTVE